MTAPHTPTTLEHYPSIDMKRSQILRAVSARSTPIFLGDRDILLERYQTLAGCLRDAWQRHVIAYSFKTNYLVAESGVFAGVGAWAEVVSGREYQLARALGYSGPSIIFNGPYKRDDDLREALGDGALVNVNDHGELDRLITLSGDIGSPVKIGLRLSCTLPRLGHSRFGFSIENQEAPSALEKIDQSDYLTVTALHMHLYGDTDAAEIYAKAARQVGEFAMRHDSQLRPALKYINLGGGFPAHSPKPKSRDHWNPQPIGVYVNAITQVLADFFPDGESAPTLILEPGRYLTSDAIMLVCQVHHVQERDGRQIVNCNASISMVPLTHYCPQIICAYTPELKPRNGHSRPTIIHGSTCRENDILYEGAFARVHPGDYLIHYAAGAYNSSLSPDFIFESAGLELF
jgi:diaminopimelate decarboxylase